MSRKPKGKSKGSTYTFQGPISAKAMAVGDGSSAQSFEGGSDLISQADKAVTAMKLTPEIEERIRTMLKELSAQNMKSPENKSVFKRIVAVLEETGSVLGTASHLLEPIKVLGQAIGLPIPW